jgi:hypothetical protein
MPKGMQAIYTRTLTGIVYTMSFNNIPQNYTDLKLVFSGRSDTANTFDGGPSFFINNGTSGNLHSFTSIKGNGSSASSQRTVDNAVYIGEVPAANATSNTFACVEIYLPEYTTSKFKQAIIDNGSSVNSTTSFLNLRAGLIRINAPVTSIGIYGGSGNWVAGSTFTLYGISR